MPDITSINKRARDWMKNFGMEDAVGLAYPEYKNDCWKVRIYAQHTGVVLGYILLDSGGNVNVSASFPNTKG